MANYSQDIRPRVKLLEHHSKKSCLRGQCNIEIGVRCVRHQDSGAIIRRWRRRHKSKPLTEERIEQTLGIYNHADRTEWRRRFPI